MTAIVLRGDAAHLPLPDGCVDLIMTSPPYFGLRSYSDNGGHYDGQIGSEATPGEYLAALVACTREWVRVLKPSGSIFVNLGDRYSGSLAGSDNGIFSATGMTCPSKSGTPSQSIRRKIPQGAIPAKSLMGLPWRYALACMDDLGLILRAEVVWSKPNGLPESVTDRVRRSHEQVFHFTRLPRYFAAVDEIREPHSARTIEDRKGNRRLITGAGSRVDRDGSEPRVRIPLDPLGKLPGSVWEIPSAPLSVPASLGVDHFAAYPPELCRRIILGWSPPGVCTACGEGRRPVSRSIKITSRPGIHVGRRGKPLMDNGGNQSREGRAGDYDTRIIGYACACPEPDASTRPAMVVDPFGGTGTTSLVADVLGRTGITVDRSADYCRLARWRTTDPGERARAMQVPKPPPVPENQGSLFDDLDATA